MKTKIKMFLAASAVMIPAGIVLTAFVFAMMWLAAWYDATSL